MTIFDEIRAYLAKSGITQSDLGRAINDDRGFITKLFNQQLRMTPERETMIRRWMFHNPDYRVMRIAAAKRERSGSGIDVSANPDLWDKDATIASAMLLAALRQHHPARCGA